MSNECPQACKDLILNMFAQQRANMTNGLWRIAGIALLCGGSAAIGALMCVFLSSS